MSVQLIKGKVFSFIVSCKQVGLCILQLRSFACPHFKCYFHLWGNGGPNWKRELEIWRKECDAEWILVSPSKKRATLGLIAMHKPPSKSSLRSGSSTRKKISFATFQQYPACKGYRYPATQLCVDTVSEAGYELNPSEKVIMPSPPASNLQWTVETPPISFGTTNVPAKNIAVISGITPICLGNDTTRKRAIDDMATNGAPDMWCAITIY